MQPKINTSITSYIPLFFNFLNTLGIPYILYIVPRYNFLCHLTLWSYFLNSFHLLLSLITDFNYYILKRKNFEKLNTFNRKTFGAVVNPFSYAVLVLFWVILIIGIALGFDTLGPTKNMSTEFIFRNLYYHFFITVFVLIDILFEQHPKVHFNHKTFWLVIIIFGNYCAVALVSIIYFDRYPYPFLEKGWFVIGVTIVACFAVVIACYFLHIWIIRLCCRYIYGGGYVKQIDVGAVNQTLGVGGEEQMQKNVEIKDVKELTSSSQTEKEKKPDNV